MGDLLKLENFNDPYKSFIIQSCEVDELAATGKWETNNNAQIRRLCSTIAHLADECSRVDRLIPKLDASAVEPLLNYNDWLNNRRSTIAFSSLANPLDFPALDIVSSLSSIVEQVCSAEEQRNRSETFSASSDEGFDTMVECSYAVSKYLADASSEYSTEDLSSYSTGTKSSRSCSPYIGERCFPGVEQQIPTRPQVKLTSQVAHNPLQFVSARTSAVALCEQAKQQIIMSEEQKRVRAEALKAMRSSSNVDEEPAWQRNLDSWLSKRKSAISKSRKVDTPKLPFKSVTRMSETKLTMRAVEANTKNNDEYIMKEKDEILSVRDSPIADEHTDSGIENSKVSPYRHSPSTSSELSPQGDWIRSRDYNVDPTDASNYVMQASWQTQHSPKHSSTSPMRPFEGSQQRVARYDPRTTHIDTLLRVDDNQQQTLEKKVDKQALIGSTERSLNGSKAEVDSSRQPSRGTAVVSSRAVKGTVSELAAKFECSQTLEPKHDVEKVFPIAHKERTANHIQTVKNDPLGSNGTSLETIKAHEDDGQNIKLGVELCREQTANVTAVKFPTRQQKCATMRSFKEFPEASRKENDDVANPYEASSSYVPYTAANLAAIKERASLGQSSNTTPPATVKKEPPEPPARPHDSPSKSAEDASRRVQSVMCTVDIPFEDVPGAAYQPNNTEQHGGTLPDADGIMVVNIDLGHHTKNPRKYFGFTVAGGKDKDAALRVESVIAGTPADECGLQVGDLILSVNGETVDDRYHQSVIRMLHEAARLGEVELKIKRASYFAGRAEAILSPSRVSIEKRQMSESISFDEKRSMFDKKSEEKDSYSEFCQRKRQQLNRSKWSNTHGLSTKHNNNGRIEKNATIVHQLANRFDAITNCVKYGLTNERFTQNGARSRSISPYYDEDGNEMESNRERCSTFSSSTDSAIFESSFQLGSTSLSSSRSSPRSNADYRVISLHDKPEPGKLSDFIPEVERATTAQTQHTDNCNREYRHREIEPERQHVVSSLSEVDDARPKLVRNYDITPLRSDPVSPVQQKIVDFTKRAEEMTYIPLAKKPPPVPQKPSPPPPPPSSTLPPEEEEEDHDDDTQPGRSFVDSREWRQIIEQQRLPNAGDTIGKNRMNADSKFRIVHSSAGSLKESLLNSSSWSSARSLRSTGLGDVSKLNNTGMSAVESLKPKNTTSVLRTSVEVLHRFPDQTHCRSTEAERPSEVLSSDGGREQCCSNAKPSEPVVAVSGKHRCSHCQMELGRGAAMIIESLNLFYHLGCFRCYVCNRSLGNGTQGADVRVRQSKLHCQTCYSNDEAGLKFSQV
uniref:LIM and calponiny domains-containing protein 1 n=1 Tax=Ascaris suum TaxID=6253 RepID=F1KS00_ASCSU